ncbi:MAG TPA: hypothetical protein PLF30_00050 [Candidatus Moranbacteria bacterium]|jgi:hypothetical protein|nr:hypothetical protein [Candidatus Moranbacteria bacterium]HOF42538.1 hypothetical protein [Candidatus Moranbacteria bacterium]HPX93948.1 hypothetical protein [Candidatus Moranbacteria bacterium]HQB59325.1 hypothetical protein [Candidatus Moranbacteria bacterium]
MEPIKSNLEPIEESDLNLKEKLKGIEPKPLQEKTPVPFAAEREIPKEIAAGEKNNAYSQILSKIQAQNAQDFDKDSVESDAHAALHITDADSQVQHLVDLAQQKGVFHAVKVAQHMEDNYILDTFHDKLLAKELHDALVAKGMIKEI